MEYIVAFVQLQIFDSFPVLTVHQDGRVLLGSNDKSVVIKSGGPGLTSSISYPAAALMYFFNEHVQSNL